MTENNLVAEKKSPIEVFKQTLETESVKEMFRGALSNTNISMDKFKSALINSCRSNPKLLECDKKSLIVAAANIAQAGLMVDNVFNHAYIVPYGGRAQSMISYTGIIYLAHQNGVDLSAKLVYKNDVFEHEYGFTPILRHKPTMEERGPVIGAYCVWRYGENGYKDFIYMRIEEIEAIRNRAKFKNPIWTSDYEDMVKKTVIRKAKKYLPLGVQSALSVEPEDFSKNNLQEENNTASVMDNKKQIDELEDRIIDA